ncbi:hypothetical protein PIB30_014912 [Stylosanthes scabra]|uniref:Uncharacterized protein n=1 Tax=Stylosanthes scabra TaxID=79078 RepID=A0ABU6U5Q7_9FABA|nr:hypothetical protein [Stylosanthes scabra]
MNMMEYATPTAPPLEFESAMIHPQMMPSTIIPTTTPSPSPFMTAIIHPQYCAPYPVGLVVNKGKTVLHKYTVTDMNGNLVFTVTNPFFTVREHRFLCDAHGNTILHLHRQVFRDRWKAFRGQSMENMEIFTRKESSLFQLRTTFDVFLANNTTRICDFKLVKAGFFARSWVVNIAQSDIVVAEIKHKVGRMFRRDKFMVTISPNIDYAFIVALTLTLDDYMRRMKRRLC